MAGELVVNGALLQCSMGAAPASASFIPMPGAPSIDGQAVGKVTDRIPGMNVPPFGTCNASSPPKPCAPAFPADWAPGSPRLSVNGVMAIDSACTLSCAQGGVVTVTYPGQARDKSA